MMENLTHNEETTRTNTVISAQSTIDVASELSSDSDLYVVVREPAPISKNQFPEKFAHLKISLSAFHNWTSLFILTIGALIVIVGCAFAIIINYNAMLAITVAFVSVVTGVLFIGISKIIEAAEIYVYKNQHVLSQKGTGK